MAKGGKKKKNTQLQTLPLGEFLEMGGNGNVPIYKEIIDGDNKRMINISEIPLAPQSSFDVKIKPHILKAGPPYPLISKNMPYETNEESLKQFFGCQNANIEFQCDEAKRPKGMALVTFDTLEDYKTALEKDGFKMGARSIYLTQGRAIIQFEDSFNNKDNKKKSRYQSYNSEIESEMAACTNWRTRSTPTQTNVPKPNSFLDKLLNRNPSSNTPALPRRDEKTSNYTSAQSNYNSSTNRGDRDNWRNSLNLFLYFTEDKKLKTECPPEPEREIDLSILRNPNKKMKDIPSPSSPDAKNPFFNRVRQSPSTGNIYCIIFKIRRF
ncbi:hypothetical protein HZS_124 [Henneguya salminicola]|nr:hypothetical protein HZS_124 [Henneguya salminicola]